MGGRLGKERKVNKGKREGTDNNEKGQLKYIGEDEMKKMKEGKLKKQCGKGWRLSAK